MKFKTFKIIDKHISKIAFPALADTSVMSILMIINSILVGNLGKEALASIGLVKLILHSSDFLFFSFSISFGSVVANLLGKRNYFSINTTLTLGIIFSLIIAGLIAIFLSIYKINLINLLTKDNIVTVYLNKYINIVIFLLPFTYLTFILKQFFYGILKPNIALKGTILMALTNTIASYLFIYPLNFGFIGAAWGDVLAITVTFLFFIFFLKKTQFKISFKNFIRIFPITIKKIFKIFRWLVMENFLRRLIYASFMKIVASLGTLQLAAHQIIVNIEAISYMPAFGLATAARNLVAKSLGAKKLNQAKIFSIRIFQWAFIISLLIATILLIFNKNIVWIFTKDASVIAVASILILIAAFEQIPMNLTIALSGVFKGAGLTKYTFLSSFLGGILIRLPLSFLLAIKLGFGVIAVWIVTSIEWIIRGIFLYSKLHKIWEKNQ